MNDSDLDRMLHPDEARQKVLERVRTLEPERVALDAAGDRILAEALVADRDLPPFRASTMDGYAVVHDDVSLERSIVAEGFAGADLGVSVAPGTVTTIMTGAPVPDGADAVVQIENTSRSGDAVTINQEVVQPGSNIRPIGSDMRTGDVLVAAGSKLGPPEIGLLASLGHDQVLVGRHPKVAVFSTGDELVEPGSEPGPGQIRDSNRFSLALAARRAGSEVVLARHIPDREPELRAAFAEALELADVIISSGGVSMGDRDLVKALLGEFAEVHFRRVFMKPGKPLNFATAGKTLLFGLPGNPVSCLVSFHNFVRPALMIMQGAQADPGPIAPVRVLNSIQPSDRIEYQRAIVRADQDGYLVAETTGSQMSARLMSFIGANAYLIVPPGDIPIAAGASLPAVLLDAPNAAVVRSE